MHLQGELLSCVRGERRLFSGVSLRLAPGEALCLTGDNGAGKSSLLRLLAGLLRPAAGCLRMDGVPVISDEAAYRDRLHFIGHSEPVKAAFSVHENLDFWTRLMGHGSVPAQACDSALEVMGIAHLAAIPARLLSSGQRKRLNLARLAAVRRELWLLDEPFSSLDADATNRLRDLILAHLGGGGIAVIATHADMGFKAAQQLRLQNTIVAEMDVL